MKHCNHRSMIKNELAQGMILSVQPRRIYDRNAGRYTDEQETTKEGSPRYRVMLAIPGQPEPLPITVSADIFAAGGLDTDDCLGEMVSVEVRMKVEPKWSIATKIGLTSGNAVSGDDFE